MIIIDTIKLKQDFIKNTLPSLSWVKNKIDNANWAFQTMMIDHAWRKTYGIEIEKLRPTQKRNLQRRIIQHFKFNDWI